MLIVQSCLTLCEPADYSPPSSSVHGILEARILEWVAVSFSRGSFQPRDRTYISGIASTLFTIWATREDLDILNFVQLFANEIIYQGRKKRAEIFSFFFWVVFSFTTVVSVCITQASHVPQMVKKSACNERDTGSILGLGKTPEERNTYPLQYSCLENSIDRETWWATVHGVTKSQIRLND